MHYKDGKIKRLTFLFLLRCFSFLFLLEIFLLVFAASSFAGIFVKDNKVKQAEESLSKIYSAIEEVEGEGKEVEVLVESPNDWWIVSWPRAFFENPVKCGGSYCLCICNFNVNGDYLEKCNENGICVDASVEIDNTFIAIKGLTPLKIFLDNEEIKIQEVKDEM